MKMTEPLINKARKWKDFDEEVISVDDLKKAVKKLKSKRNNGDFIHLNDIEKIFGEFK